MNKSIAFHLARRLRRRGGHLLPVNSFTTGLFGIDALSSPAGFEIIERNVYSECSQLIDETAAVHRSRKMVEIFDDLSNSICKVADLAECMRNLHPDPQFVFAAEECMARLSSFVEQLNTNADLYKRLKKYSEIEGDETDKRVAQLFASDFENSGVHLPNKQREKFVALSEEIFRVGSFFCRGCEIPTKIPVQKKGGPLSGGKLFASSLLQLMSKEEQNDQDNLTYVADCGADSPSAERRQLMYKLFYQPSADQELYLRQLTEFRRQLAETAGFASYAHRSLRDCILNHPDDVECFLTDLIRILKPQAEQEIATLQHFLPTGHPVAIWDVPYLKSVHRGGTLSNLSHKLRGRFNVQTVLQGIIDLTYSLYGVTMKKQPVISGETWHDDVEKLEVFDESGAPCGTIYCDWFDRQMKNTSDSHFTVRCGKQLPSGSYQTPVVVLTFRYSKESGQNSLSLIEFTNILHEFGHAMHSILGRTRYQHVAGTRCPTDFAEIPSNLMEFFLSDERTLLNFADNISSKFILDDAEKQAVIQATSSFSALDTLQQAIYSLFDLRLHREPLVHKSTIDLFEDICDQTWPFLKVPGTAWHHRFSHLVPYGSKYHAYLIARGAASLTWQRVFKEDPCSRLAGERWRKVQAYGGEFPPSDLLELLLNKKLQSTDLSSALSSLCS